MERPLPFTQEHKMFREALGKFLDKEMVPYYEQWEKDMIVPKAAWKQFGDYGYLCPDIPEEYGGAGADFLYNVIIVEEIGKRGLQGIYVRSHNDVCAPYITKFGTEEQKKKYLPGCCTGDTVLAIGFTEPGAGSDLAAIRTTAKKEGDYYIVNGSKTFISSGINADLIILAVKTDSQIKPAHKGISLLLVERDTPGFERGKQLRKIGMHAQDTAELFFDNAKVPVANLLGEEGKGFYYLMQKLQQERLSSSLDNLAKAERSLELTKQYVTERSLFGRTLNQFQNTQHVLAKCEVEIVTTRIMADQMILQHINGVNASHETSVLKYYSSEMCWRVADQCLQLFGGYGYCEEYPIAKQFVDSRIGRIFAGTSEVMLNIIAQGMGLGKSY